MFYCIAITHDTLNYFTVKKEKKINDFYCTLYCNSSSTDAVKGIFRNKWCKILYFRPEHRATNSKFSTLLKACKFYSNSIGSEDARTFCCKTHFFFCTLCCNFLSINLVKANKTTSEEKSVLLG